MLLKLTKRLLLPVRTRRYSGYLLQISPTESATRSQTFLAPFKIPEWAVPPRKGTSSQTMSSSASLKDLVPRTVRTMDLL